jgi:colicin import membrane protein
VSAIGVTRGEKTVSGALALGMHLLFALLLIFGVAWQQRRSDAPVTVDLWSNLPPQPRAEAPPPEVKPEPEPPPPPPPKAVEPKAEPEPAPKPDIALKEKAEKERKRKEEERAEQERKRQEKEKAEAKKREEEKKRVAALKEKQAAEARRREQEEAQRKLAQAAQASAQQRLIDDYKRRISDKIRRYVVLPPNLQGNPEAEFDVVQIPGGEVLSVRLKRSSGNSAYDAAVERAIHKAQPLPPPPQGFTFGEFRELSLKFRPRE